MSNMLIDNVRVMPKGQMVLPKEALASSGVDDGNNVTVITEQGRVMIMNSAVSSMKFLQDGMEGEAEKAGFYSEDDVCNFLGDIRRETEEL